MNQISGDNRESVRNVKGFNTIFSDSSVNFFAKIISNVSYFLFITFAIKILGEKKYGEYGIFLMTSQFLYIGFLVWLQSGIVRYGREEFLEHQKINKILYSHLIISIPIILVLTIIVFIFQSKILEYLNFNNFFIYLIIIYFIFNYLTETLYYFLQAIGEMQIMAIAQIIEKLTPLILILLSFYFLKFSKLTFLIVSILVGYFFSELFILFKINKNIFHPIILDFTTLNRYVKYSLPIFLGSLASYFLSWIDIGIIKKLLSIDMVGKYFYCQQIYNGINQINLIVATILSPLVITLIIKNRTDIMKKILNDLSLIGMSLFLFLINILFFIFYFLLLFIFKENIFNISFTLNVLLLSIPLTLFLNVLATFINSYELTWCYAINTIVTLALKIILSYLLISEYGIKGGAIAVFICGFLSIVYYLYFLRKRIEFELKKIIYFTLILILFFTIYGIVKNVYISFIINFLILILYIKYSKMFAREKIEIINNINIPVVLKNKFISVFNILNKIFL